MYGNVYCLYVNLHSHRIICRKPGNEYLQLPKVDIHMCEVKPGKYNTYVQKITHICIHTCLRTFLYTIYNYIFIQLYICIHIYFYCHKKIKLSVLVSPRHCGQQKCHILDSRMDRQISLFNHAIDSCDRSLKRQEPRDVVSL